MENLTGRWLAGRYNLQQFLGRGSIGDVYKAWDRQRAIHLSLKLLQLDLAEDKLFLSNFQRDSQALIRLQHTYIVCFYGLEQADGLVFLLMDYIEGSTLGLEIPRTNGPFSMAQAMFILRPVCAALHYAHQMGVVHGDLKPANILIHRKGTVLITDVGVKRMVESACSSSRHFPGTPAYMAPEQIRGQSPTARSDIYALGVVLFEMLTGGKRPFEGEHAKISGSTDERISWEQVNLAPPALRRLNPAVPANVEAAVMRCLEKQPEQRFEKPMELLDAVEGSYQAPAAARPPAAEIPVQSTANLRPPVAEKPAPPPMSAPAAGQLEAARTADASPTDRQLKAACPTNACPIYSQLQAAGCRKACSSSHRHDAAQLQAAGPRETSSAACKRGAIFSRATSRTTRRVQSRLYRSGQRSHPRSRDRPHQKSQQRHR